MPLGRDNVFKHIHAFDQDIDSQHVHLFVLQVEEDEDDILDDDDEDDADDETEDWWTSQLAGK